MPTISNLRQWRNGEVFNASDYVYERNLILAQVNRLTSILGDGGTPGAITVSSITMAGKTRSYFGAEVFYDDDLPAEADRYVGLVYFDEE